MEWNLTLVDTKGNRHPIALAQLEQWKDEAIPVERFLPGKQAEAVIFPKLLEQLEINDEYSQAVFKAGDGFSQSLKAADLTESFLVYKQKGELLKKGFPVRLYVPGSDSDCLNVKSVVVIELKND